MLKEQIEHLVEAKFAGTDYFLVEIKESPAKAAVFIDSTTGAKLSDCVELSKFLRTELGETLDSRELEVSSPGMEEPLKVRKQYLKNIGKEITVLLKDGIRKNGILKKADNEGIEIMQRESALWIPFNNIKETKEQFNF